MFRFDAAFRGEFRQNGLVLITAFCTLLFGFSAPAFALPFIFPEVIREFGWTREQAALLASAKYLAGFFAALLVGRFIDTTGVWLALIVSIGLGGVGLIGFLFVDNLTVYYLLGVLLGIAGPGAMTAVQVLVSRTFTASVGTALGLVLLGTSLGSVIVPQVVTPAIGELGWRGGVASLSLGVWVLAMPLLFYGYFSNPRAAASTQPRNGAASAAVSAPPPPRLRAMLPLMKGRNFWLIAGATFLTAMADQAFIQHQVLILKDLQMTPSQIALAVSAIGIIGIAARPVAGNILDSLSNRGLALMYAFLSAAAVLAFALVNPWILLAFILARAIGHAAVLIDSSVMAKHTFGPSHLGSLVGFYIALTSLAFSLGPWLMGRMFDRSGSYESAFILFAILPVAAAIMAWSLRPLYFEQQNEIRRNQPAAQAGV